MKTSFTLKLFLAITAFTVGVSIATTNAVKKLDYSFLDWMMITENPVSEPSTVVVAADQYTYSLFGWPIDRDIYAGVVSVLADAQAKKIGFDLFFTDRKEERDPADLEQTEKAEELLGIIGAEKGVVFGSFINHDGRKDISNKKYYPPTPEKTLGKCSCPDLDEKKLEKAEFSYLEQLVPGIAKFSQKVAHVHVIPSEVDRVNRSIIGCIPVFDGCVVDISIAMTGADIDEGCCDEQIIPYFRKSDDFEVISMSDVIFASENEEKMKELELKVKGKYVLIGATDETLKDVGPTPSGNVEPLVFLHANRLEALLNDVHIRIVPEWTIHFISFLLLIVIIFLFNSIRYYLVFLSVPIPVIYVAGYFIFRSDYTFIYPFAAFLPLVLANISVAGYLGWKYFLFNRILSNAFDSYVSPEILNWLKSTGGEVLRSDSAERRSITILFSDIAGYTSLSNSLNAEKIMKSLRLYLDAMMVVTARHNGYVDKINGDGLMILFGAPKPFEDHSEKAVKCAMAMQEKVLDLQKEWKEITGIDLKIRIGIATDTVFVGNIGGAGHIEYSAIGRGVNFAARLESKSEIGGILVSEETIGHSGWRPDGYKRSLTLKGYEKEVEVWQIPP